MEASAAKCAAAPCASTIALMEAGTATVLAPAGTNAVHIVGSLGASHGAILHGWVVVVGRLGEAQYVFPHAAPIVGVAAVLPGQCHGIADVEVAAIVGG